MGGGASKPKKIAPDRAAGSAKALSILESHRSDEDAAAAIAALRKIDADFMMNLMYHDEDGWNLLHVASSSRVDGEAPACINALLAHKCDVNAIASGTSRFMHTHNSSSFAYENSTPLIFCAQNGRVETMKALLQGNADINVRSGDGGTALHVAAAHLQLEAARLLVDSGIDGTITSGVETTLPQRKRKQRRKKQSESPWAGEEDSDEEKDGEDDEEQAPQPRATAAGPAQYGTGLTAAQVVAETRNAALLAQDLVEYSLEGFEICGKMKDEVDLAEEIYQLLSTMKVPPKAVEEIAVTSLAGQSGDIDSLSSGENGVADDAGESEDKVDEISNAAPAT